MRTLAGPIVAAVLIAGCSGTTQGGAGDASDAGAGRGVGDGGGVAKGGEGGRAGTAGSGGGAGNGAGAASGKGGPGGGGQGSAGMGGGEVGSESDAGTEPGDGGAAAGCAAATYALCEDFESTGPGDVPSGWTQIGAAAVAADQKHGGDHSLKMEAAATGQRRIRRDLDSLGAMSGTHWGRIFYRVTPQPVPTDRVIHATFVGLRGTSPLHDDEIEVRVVDTVANVTGKHQFLFNVEPDGERQEFGNESPYDWTFDGEWHCAEWHVVYAMQSYGFFIDSVEVTEIAQNNGAGRYDGTELPERFSSIALGINNYQDAAFGGSPGYVMWIDDFALDDARIGCD